MEDISAAADLNDDLATEPNSLTRHHGFLSETPRRNYPPWKVKAAGSWRQLNVRIVQHGHAITRSKQSKMNSR